MLKAVIFDMDGTLGDTLPLCVEAFRQCVDAEIHRLPTPDEVTEHFGISDRGVLGALLGMNPDDPALPIHRLVEIYKKLHPALAPAPFEGAKETLVQLRSRGIKVALLTGKERYTADPTLQQFDLAGLFDLELFGVPTHNCKGEQLREVMQTWSLRPEEIIYVGDTPTDIEVCHQEGVRIINAAWSTDAEQLKEACLAQKPEFRLEHLTDLLPLIEQIP